MTPADLAQAWPNGLPPAGTIDLRLAPWAEESQEFRDVLQENIQLLKEGISKGIGFFEQGFDFDLEPTPVTGGIWPIRYRMPNPATDAFAYCLNGFAALRRGIEEPWYTDLRIQPNGQPLEPHRMAIPVKPGVAPVDADGRPLSQQDLVMMQEQEIHVQVPVGQISDFTAMEDAMMAVAELVDIGAFDLPLDGYDYELASPLIGLSEDEGSDQIGLIGFRGAGDLAAVLVAAVETALGQHLPKPEVIISDANAL